MLLDDQAYCTFQSKTHGRDGEGSLDDANIVGTAFRCHGAEWLSSLLDMGAISKACAVRPQSTRMVGM